MQLLGSQNDMATIRLLRIDEAVKAAKGMRGSVPDPSRTDASSEKTASLFRMYDTRDRLMRVRRRMGRMPLGGDRSE